MATNPPPPPPPQPGVALDPQVLVGWHDQLQTRAHGIPSGYTVHDGSQNPRQDGQAFITVYAGEKFCRYAFKTDFGLTICPTTRSFTRAALHHHIVGHFEAEEGFRPAINPTANTGSKPDGTKKVGRGGRSSMSDKVKIVPVGLAQGIEGTGFTQKDIEEQAKQWREYKARLEAEQHSKQGRGADHTPKSPKSSEIDLAIQAVQDLKDKRKAEEGKVTALKTDVIPINDRIKEIQSEIERVSAACDVAQQEQDAVDREHAQLFDEEVYEKAVENTTKVGGPLLILRPELEIRQKELGVLEAAIELAQKAVAEHAVQVKGAEEHLLALQSDKSPKSPKVAVTNPSLKGPKRRQGSKVQQKTTSKQEMAATEVFDQPAVVEKGLKKNKCCETCVQECGRKPSQRCAGDHEDCALSKIMGGPYTVPGEDVPHTKEVYNHPSLHG
ncbi:hypothetical protein CSPX01_09932 [Colletotrichum filicis]|nr:hypothetical protein CSPX01_09932 [Colletotrichum filicis]